MPVTRKVKPTQKLEVRTAAVQVDTSHRQTDLVGIGIVATSIVVLITMSAGRGGVIGNFMAEFFTSMFGIVAWLVPFAMMALGVAMVLGHRKLESTRIGLGILLIMLSLVGLLAKSRQGDFFDPQIAASSGGYIGATLAWFFDLIFGQAKAVAIGAIAAFGLILTIDTPIRLLFQNAFRKRDPIQKQAVRLPQTAATLKQSALAEASQRATEKIEKEPQQAKANRLATRINPITAKSQTQSLDLVETTQREGYELPPMNLLREPAARPKAAPEEMQRNIEVLERTLEEFGIESNVVDVTTGPTITRFEVQLGPGIRVGRITALADNIAMNLAASHVRVEAPIPGKNAIGVEVPNEKSAVVSLRELCNSKEFQELPGKLIVGLGQDVSGNNRYADLTKMPHLLIGGATNSGKSIGLATIITSLIMRNTPKECRLVMIDPKRVELSLFDGIPHLMCPVVKDVKEAPGVLRAIWREMDIRYDKFAEKGVRNIDGWNEKASYADKLPYIVVIIDELADLMIQAAAEVETSIVRLAQLARAVGIHIVIATQRPSVDVITGLIKANIPSRMAFAVSSQIDSRTILDQGGAEKLVGKGDMLFMPIDATKPTRIQGCYVSEAEIESVCEHWMGQEKPQYVLNPIAVAIADKEAQLAGEESDELWADAVRFVAERGQASTSMLQRKFSIGFQRASRLLDMMEERGIVGQRDGPRPREVLIDPMQAEAMLTGQTYGYQQPVEIDSLDDYE